MPTGTLWDVLLHETMTSSERLEAFEHMVQAGIRFGEEYTSSRLVSALCEDKNQEVLVFIQANLAQLSKRYDERVWDLDGDGQCMNNQLYTKGLLSNPKGVEVALSLGANPLFKLKFDEYQGLTPREALEQELQGSYGSQISRDTLALRDAIEILWRAEQRQRRESIALAMGMGHHRRLGANTRFNTLPQDQMHLILEQVLQLHSGERVPLPPMQAKRVVYPSYRPRLRK
jgi:hypothetical protein